MAVYDYVCPHCEWQGELMHVPSVERNNQNCPECEKPLGTSEYPAPKTGKARYQMGAVLGNGQHLKGHFGKDAQRKKK